MGDFELTELLKVSRLLNLEGLRRLEIAMVPKDYLAAAAGLALLD